MDKNTKNWISLTGFIAGLAAGYLLWKNRRLFFVADVTSGESLDYPELLSRVYYGESEAILTAAEQGVRKLPRWRVVHRDSESGTVDAEAETRIGNQLDDVTVYVEEIGGNQCRVTIRSRSRQGRGDLGQNAQHIRELQNAMDDLLTRNAAI
jgi:uncharacterized protein (DUF1499 family)